MGSLGLGPLLLLLLLLTASFSAHADRTHSDVASSLQDPKYKIEFHSAEAPVLPTSDQETMVMTDRDGKKFRCNIPAPESSKVLNTEGDLRQNGTSTSLVADEWTSRKTPEDLLDVLKDKCLRRQEGWWIYELCYKGHLRQFHLHDTKAPISTHGPDMQQGSVVYFFTLVKEPSTPDIRTPRKMIVQEFVLGKYDAEATAELHSNSPNISLQKDPRSQNAAQRYHAHVYTNGTICDLTNQPRETEVRFVCSESGRELINSIKEAPTCKYTLVFHASMLCKHPAFQEERQPWVVIDCNAIPSEEVTVKEDTTLGHQSETEAHEDSVTPALIEALPQDITPSSHASEGETEDVLANPSQATRNTEETVAETGGVVANPSQVTTTTEETVVEGEEIGDEGKAGELTLPGHQRKEHPAA